MLRKFEKLSAKVREVTLADGSERWSYPQLCTEVQAWLALFDQQKVQVVAFELDNGLTWAAISLALLESDRVAVPIPSFFSMRQKRHAIADSGAQLYIGEARVHLDLPGEEIHNSCAGELRLLELTVPTVALPESTAIVTYTSGSTGTPKGVCLSGTHLLESAQALVSVLGPLDIQTHLCALPLTLLLENVAGLFANLLNGSQLQIPPLETLGLRGSSNLDVEQFVSGLHTHAPQSLILVPGQLLALVTAVEWGSPVPDSLDFVAVGGGKVASSLLERAVALGLPVYEGYGLTECGSVVALNVPGKCKIGSVGLLLPNVQAECIDGELIVKHPCMLGYVGSDLLSDVGADVGTSGEVASVATGDLVTQDTQGFLRVQGRSKNTLITAYGRNLSPEWIESELQAEVAVAQVMVFGEGASQPVALIQPRDGFQVNDVRAAVARVNSSLPDYAQIHRWTTISADSLADCNGLTPNGRLRRQSIEKHFQELVQSLIESSISPTPIPASPLHDCALDLSSDVIQEKLHV